MDEWRSVDYLQSKTISLHHLDKQVEGKVLGINESGQLLLKCVDDNIRAFSSGETSTRQKTIR